MNTSKCPSCGEPNPDTVDICQYCGTVLKRSATEPLPPIHPGDIPIKKNTSDLERTLPGWLRDMRKASGEGSNLSEAKPAETPEPSQVVAPLPEKPAPPKQKASASPLDFLAGLSQANDDEEEVPDWLKSLQNSMPAPAEPTPTPEPQAEEPADWLSGLQSETQGNEPAVASEPNWGFGDQPATYNFDENADTAPQASQDTPDWLAALKAQDEATHPAQQAVPPVGQAVGGQPPSDDDLPDWLASLSDTGIGAVPSQPESQPMEQHPTSSEDTPDWRSHLGGDTDTRFDLAPTTNAPAADTPDWLSSLGGSTDIQPDQIPAINTPAADTPDWLSSLGGSTDIQPDQIPATNAPAADTPDWLSSLGGSTDIQPDQIPAINAPAADTPDWLSSLGGSTDIQPDQIPAINTPAADTPNWLSSLGGGFTEETPAALETNQQPATDTPDWLSNLGGDALPPVEPAIAASAPSASMPATDLPPWLSDLTSDSQPAESQVAQPVLEPQSAPVEPQPIDSDVPAWMADLQGSSFTPAESPAQQEPGFAEVSPAADVPDWMDSLQGEQPESQAADFSEPAQSVDGELPSWLANAMGEKLVDKPEEPARPRKPFDTGALGELGPLDDGGELPDWMAKIGEPSATLEPAKTQEETPAQTWEGTEIPIPLETMAASEAGDIGTSFEAETEAISPAQPEPTFFDTPAEEEAPAPLPMFGEEQNLESILSLDMPDWLSGFTPTEAELSDAAGAKKPAEDNIRPADLPSWVQAMRPVEDVMGEKIDEEEEQQVESNGPLAGIRSVLPVQPGISAVYKPKVYSIKLQVDETQQAQAALLEHLLNSESTPQPVPRRPEAIIIHPLRWAIAAVLLVTILVGALLQDIVGSPVFPAPDISAKQSGIGAFKETIDNLSDDATVLVVVDYQPGFAGEMEPAAGPVISQLMGKNARLAFISTSPMGPYLAERLLQKFTEKYSYKPGIQYVNLGYLPGGAGGIQVFAELPGTTVGQDWFQGNLWQTGALKAVTLDNATKLSNFSAVIVLTDNPDTGRLWIEQAQPSMESQPMLMVVSAQAEPMIRPYLVSGQLKGLLSGLVGGTFYESQLASPGQARSYWDAFGVAVFAVELLILVGGVWSLIEGNRARRTKKMEQDEA